VRTIEIFDTTLRDGEQSAGVNLHRHEKLEIAWQLERLGVTAIEAGFPASSPGDFEAVREIAQKVRGVSVVGLARHVQGDIDAVAEALRGAEAPRLHLFIATSPVHMRDKLRLTPDQVFERAVACVRQAAGRFADIEWSAEDATRSDREFLARLCAAVAKAGATVINLPDTVGYSTPADYAELFRYLREQVPALDNVKLSAHCHDDLGLAVANTLAALQAGVQQVEVTINGIGERAGNAALEEVALALAIRKDAYQMDTSLDLVQLTRTSRLVSKLTGMIVPPNKAVVGANAFAHESGIHQDGVLKNALTYEIIRPEMVGLSASSLVLGKHSGRHAFRDKCTELGLHLSEEELQALFEAFKKLSEIKKDVADDDVLALAMQHSLVDVRPRYELAFLHVSYGSNSLTTATVGVRTVDGEILQEAATGNGSVEAIHKTIERLLQSSLELLDYRIQATTSGPDALAEVYVRIEYLGAIAAGRGVDNDVLAASAKALLDAVNRLAWRTDAERIEVTP
jgi:2-isopropylmalate synthase